MGKTENFIFLDKSFTSDEVEQRRARFIYGDENNNNLSGTAGDDIIKGFLGYDTLNGGVGDDTLIGGAGSDTLNGGVGDDVYAFARNFGQDQITDTSGNDQIVFQDIVITNPNLTLRKIGNDLVIEVDETGNKVTVKGHYTNAGKIETFIFSGTSFSAAQIEALQRRFILGDNRGNSRLFGTAGDDIIKGFAGNDLMRGFAGNDLLIGGAGDDELHSGDGNDVLYGDRIESGSDGGNDKLYGWAGDDSYWFIGDFGQDQITESSGTDTIYLRGIRRDDVTITRDGNNLVITVKAASSNKLTVVGHFEAGNQKSVENIVFQDSSGVETAKLSGLTAIQNALKTPGAEARRLPPAPAKPSFASQTKSLIEAISAFAPEGSGEGKPGSMEDFDQRQSITGETPEVASAS